MSRPRATTQGVRHLLALLVMIAIIGAPPARAGCIDALVVDGRLLENAQVPSERLPPGAQRVAAVAPACNDAGQGEPDRRTTATAVRGLLPSVAVIHHGSLYVARGTLAGAGGHPLRRSVRRPPRLPVRRRCRVAEALRGRARDDGAAHGLAILTRGRERDVVVDGRTRIAGARPERPVLRGQRLAVATSTCGGHRFADRVELIAPILQPQRIVPDFDRKPAEDGGIAIGLVLIAALPLLFLTAVAAAVTRRG